MTASKNRFIREILRKMHPAFGRGGFTLIETTLALALTAIGLIALLGLIPHGLDVMKTATDKSVEARIAQELTGEIMLADWIRVDEYDKTLRYFDNEGVEIENTSEEETGEVDQEFANRLTYSAYIEIPDVGSEEGDGFRLPGVKDSDPNMKRVVINVVNTPFEIDLTDITVREEYKDRISTHAATVVKTIREY